MKIVTWNIQWGLGMNGRVNLAGIVEHAQAMAGTELDVLCLQEVSDNMPDLQDSGGEDQFAALAALMPGYRAIEGAGVDITDETGARRRFGNMILTRLPVRQVIRHALPWIGGGRRSMPRILLEATVMAPIGPLRVMTTHLEYSSPRIRAAQVEAIRAIHAATCERLDDPPEVGPGPYALQPCSRSALLTGDFNMKPDDPTKRRICEPSDGVIPLLDTWQVLHGEAPHPPSFCIADQTYGAAHCCDFVFATEDLAPRLEEVAYDTETRLSDHQPICVTLAD